MKNYWIDKYNSTSKQFVNRTEIRKIIVTECNHNIQKHNYFKVISIYGDCDRDTILIKVVQTGAACHTGSHSCFFREIKKEEE